MNRRISEDNLLKWIWALIAWLAITCGGLIFALNVGPLIISIFFFIIPLVILSYYLWLAYKSLIWVNMSHKGLDIRTFHKSCFVLFEDIKSISGGYQGIFSIAKNRLITLELKNATVFGVSIQFFLQTDFGFFKELKRKKTEVYFQISNRIKEAQESITR